LEKRKIEDSLRHKINHRPTAEALVEQNILKGNVYVFQHIMRLISYKDPKVAPALQRQQHDLERHLLQDTLEHKIHDRPEPAELVQQGILTGTRYYFLKLLFAYIITKNIEEEVPK
jgi:hypothetical protein